MNQNQNQPPPEIDEAEMRAREVVAAIENAISENRQAAVNARDPKIAAEEILALNLKIVQLEKLVDKKDNEMLGLQRKMDGAKSDRYCGIMWPSVGRPEVELDGIWTQRDWLRLRMPFAIAVRQHQLHPPEQIPDETPVAPEVISAKQPPVEPEVISAEQPVEELGELELPVTSQRRPGRPRKEAI